MISKMSFIFIPLFFLLIPDGNSFSEEKNWDQILEEVYDQGRNIKLEKINNSDEFVVYLYTPTDLELTDKTNIYLQFEKYLKNSDKNTNIILSNYIMHLMDEDEWNNKKLKQLLDHYIDSDKDNALPAYLYSYFYAANSDYKNYLKYLKIGNNRKNYDLYIDEKIKLVFEYYYKNTNDELFSYILAQPIYTEEVDGYLFKLAGLKDSKIDLFEEGKFKLPYSEIYKMGIKKEKFSKSIVGKNTGIGIQLYYSNIDNQQKLDELKERLSYLRTIPKNLNSNKRYGRENLKLFLTNWYKSGEIYAFEKLPEIK